MTGAMRGRRASTAPATAGEILVLIRQGSVATRTEIGRATGLSRTAVAARVERLLAEGLLTELQGGAATGGRPAARLAFHAGGGTVLAASVGVSRTSLAVCDLAGTVLAQDSVRIRVSTGPEAVMRAVGDRLAKLLGEAGADPAGVRGIGLSIPGTVDPEAGSSCGVPVLPGWAGVPLAPLLSARFPVAVRVENDVNVMAIAEQHARPEVRDLLVVKVSTGIGAAVVSDGGLRRGARGSAGEIGHTRIADGPGVACHCGNVDCIEALASGSALIRDLTAAGRKVDTVSGVVELVQAGDAEAVRLVRVAGRRIGEVLADAVNLLNPAVITVGGDLVGAYEPLVAGIRESVFKRAVAIATQTLRIEPGALAGRSGVTGCAILVLDQVLSPAAVDSVLSEVLGDVLSSEP
ncbi:ROK family transcriptional regulator [Pseudonocardia ailaonensis]|uniref:ROK family transcriptional regulator n=1 Tax=Pseudonocardia ailaonensis TaxID=367279 RepID=A0ABN2MNU6_9PSEU